MWSLTKPTFCTNAYTLAGLTEIIAAAAGEPGYAERTWVLITESPEGGWGIGGHANTNADIAASARAALAAD